MPEAASPKTGKTTKAKTTTTEGTEDKKPAAARSNFAKLYPEDAPLSLVATENPKRKGSKSAERFEGYTGADTVGAALANGVTYQDIAHDVGRGFIKVG